MTPRSVFVSLLTLLITAGCASAPRGQSTAPPTSSPMAFDAGPTIRVGLVVEKSEVTFEATAAVNVTNTSGDVLGSCDRGSLAASRSGRTLTLTRNGEVCWSGRGPVRMQTTGAWKTKGNEYVGELEVRRANTGVTLVNLVRLEEYLRGVVPWEIGRPGREALEAVKTQAIAARTYTHAHLGAAESLGFDVWDSVTDQVYRGRTGIDPMTDAAIWETRGMVAAHRGELVRAYYSSTCGGHSSTVEDVWEREPAPYLIGRRDHTAPGSTWCSESPHFRWTETWSAKQLGETIRTHLPAQEGQPEDPSDIGRLTGLSVVERDDSGRVRRLRIETTRGEFEVQGDRIRWVLRPVESRFAILRSTLFDLELEHRGGALVAVRARGGGFGHGVGMCQTGAIAMARAGHTVAEILAHYYRDVEVVDASALAHLP